MGGMDMKWILAVLAATAGCGGWALGPSASSSYVAEQPEEGRAASPRWSRSPEPVRSPEHSAALANELLEANGRGEAEAVTAACDLGFAVGNADGYQTGIEFADGAVEVHCIRAIPARMIKGYLVDAGGDKARAMEKARKRCERPETPPAVSKYGESLLLVTRRCGGNQICALLMHNALTNCYLAGMKQTVGDEPEKVLGRMLNTCVLFEAMQPACQNDAYSSRDALRKKVRDFRVIGPRR